MRFYVVRTCAAAAVGILARVFEHPNEGGRVVTRVRGVVCVALLVAAASVFAAGLAVAAGPAGPSARALAGVNFISVCAFSHRAPDDPIVSPGQPGASHDHSFVGNASTSAFSNLRTLLAA